jgi:hypothetical protein
MITDFFFHCRGNEPESGMFRFGLYREEKVKKGGATVRENQSSGAN